MNPVELRGVVEEEVVGSKEVHVVFVSWRMAECKKEVEALQKSLQPHGVKVVVVGELPGGDLLQSVIEGMEAADLFIIMGTETYGRQTSGIIDTYKEMQYIVASKKPYFLFNMNTELSLMRFSEGAANLVFNLNTIAWERWAVGAPIPPKSIPKILKKLEERGNRSRAGGRSVSPPSTTGPKELTEDNSGEEKGMEREESGSVDSSKMVLMVSAPETGPDGIGGFTFPVMEKILQLSKTAKNMVVAYDWAGSSNKFPDDQAKFDMIFEDTSNDSLFKKWCSAPNDAAKEEVLKEIAPLVKSTRWFAAYCGAVKNTIKVYCQKEEDVLLVCIVGGPITRVEAAEMPRLRKEAMADLEKLGVLTPSIEICNVATFQKFEQLVKKESLFEIRRETDIEDQALAKELLLLLQSAADRNLNEGQQHIKSGNLQEAKGCFEQVTHAPKGVSPEDLALTKLLLAYTLYQVGVRSLQARKFDDAALQFDRVLEDPPTRFDNARLQKLRLFHACALYEAGKQHREDGDWGAAKKLFEAATKTKKLPSDLQAKSVAYLKESKKMRDDIDDKYDSLNESEDDEVAGNVSSEDTMKAFEVYKQAKRSMENGMVNQARIQFEEAKEIGLSKALKKRAKKFLRVLDEYGGEEATQCVFSDNCTHLLGSTAVTLGLSTSTLGLSMTTMSVSTPKRISQEMVMVLDQKFPPESEARGQLILLLKADIHKAISSVSESAGIQIRDMVAGSVIVHFRFVSDDDGNAAYLEEQYMQQVDDKDSKLYQGKVTCRIDQKRTQTMTMQLSSMLASRIPCMHEVGDTITLAQVEEERIECKVKSLLGEGATATVFKVVNANNGKLYALKVFKAANSFVDLCEEASLMLAMNHPQSHPVSLES
jgi:tetratricopeptide (TPR) repeat protein